MTQALSTKRNRMALGAILLLLALVLPVALGVVSVGAFHSGSESIEQSEAMEYLSEVAFGVEYGSTDPVLHKWTEDIRIKVHGSPTVADLETLELVAGELNLLVDGISLEIVDQDANLQVYFVPESSFSDIEPTYVPVNLGFFRVWFDGEGAIQQGTVLIASDSVSQLERSHLIREELTQSLGLFRDSWRHSDSIFYEGWTTTNIYHPLDAATIQMLYDPQLVPGMDRTQVRTVYAPTPQ